MSPSNVGGGRRSRFFLIMAILSAATVAIGFGTTYGPKVLDGSSEVPRIIHVHALVFTTWMVLLIVQTTLIARGRVDIHQRLGLFGGALIFLMLAVGFFASVDAARSGHTGIPGLIFETPAAFLMLNFNALLQFSTVALIGLWFRKNPNAHKRLMLTATVVGLVPPGASRLPVVGPTPLIVPIVLGFVLAGPIHDVISRRKRPHPAYWAGASIVFSLPPVVSGLAASETWQRFTAWLIA